MRNRKECHNLVPLPDPDPDQTITVTRIRSLTSISEGSALRVMEGSVNPTLQSFKVTEVPLKQNNQKHTYTHMMRILSHD